MPQQLPVVYDEQLGRFRVANPGEVAPTGPTAPFAPPQTDQPREMNLSMSPRDVVGTGLKVGGAALGLLPGTGPTMTGARIVLPALFQGAGEAVEGGDPMSKMANETAIGGITEGLARSIPVVGNALALASGGALNRFKQGFWPTVNAFVRQGERFTNPNVVGRTNEFTRFPWMNNLLHSSEEAKKRAGQMVERAETSNPARVPLEDVVGTPKAGRKVSGGPNEDFAAKSIDSDRPLSLPRKIENYDWETLEETAIARMGLDRKQYSSLINHTARVYGVPPHEARIMVLEAMVQKADLGMRDLGNIKRSLNAKNPVVIARSKGQMVSPDDETIKQARANLAQRINQERLARDTDSRSTVRRFLDIDQGGDMARADRQFSDAAIMHEGNQALRSGSLLGDLSLWASRGALGGSLGWATGIGAAPGTALGLTLLNPMALSLGSTWLGRATRPTTAVVRANRDVKRRAPDKDK